MSQASQQNDRPERLLAKARQSRDRLDFAESERILHRQKLTGCARHFKVEGDPSALSAAVRTCDPVGIRRQAVELESLIMGKAGPRRPPG